MFQNFLLFTDFILLRFRIGIRDFQDLGLGVFWNGSLKIEACGRIFRRGVFVEGRGGCEGHDMWPPIKYVVESVWMRRKGSQQKGAKLS